MSESVSFWTIGFFLNIEEMGQDISVLKHWNSIQKWMEQSIMSLIVQKRILSVFGNHLDLLKTEKMSMICCYW